MPKMSWRFAMVSVRCFAWDAPLGLSFRVNIWHCCYALVKLPLLGVHLVFCHFPQDFIF